MLPRMDSRYSNDHPALFLRIFIDCLLGCARSMFSAQRRTVDIFLAEWSFLSRHWSSANITSSIQWTLFSIPQCSRALLRIWLAGNALLVMKYRSSIDIEPLTILVFRLQTTWWTSFHFERSIQSPAIGLTQASRNSILPCPSLFEEANVCLFFLSHDFVVQSEKYSRIESWS